MFSLANGDSLYNIYLYIKHTYNTNGSLINKVSPLSVVKFATQENLTKKRSAHAEWLCAPFVYKENHAIVAWLERA